MRLMWFDYEIVHVPEKELYTADTLSRAPVKGLSDADINHHSLTHSLKLLEETIAFVNFFQKSLPASDKRLEQMSVVRYGL